jgi:hypothetical protein
MSFDFSRLDNSLNIADFPEPGRPSRNMKDGVVMFLPTKCCLDPIKTRNLFSVALVFIVGWVVRGWRWPSSLVRKTVEEITFGDPSPPKSLKEKNTHRKGGK